jgi:hypothetical protein
VHKLLVGGAVIAALLLIFVLGDVQRESGGLIAAPLLALVPAAEAAPPAPACAVPSLATLAGAWVVRSARCANASCARAHFAAGDRLGFERDISGEANFSFKLLKRASPGFAARTEGYALRSDGVATVQGPIVLDHDPLDGSPLDLHWLIVDVRAYDADGYGNCKVTARVQVCSQQPGAGATACDDKQHGGIIVLDPP